MKTIKEIENFFDKQFTIEDLTKVIDNLQDKAAFFSERSFVSTSSSDNRKASMNNSDVVSLSLIENGTNSLIANTYFSPNDKNKLIEKNLPFVVQKLAFEVYQNKYKNVYEYQNSINNLMTKKKDSLNKKSLSQCLNEVEKEAYYIGGKEKSYNLIKSFNPERTNRIDFLVMDKIINKIETNKSINEIKNFYSKIARYSSIKTPSFIANELKAKDFQKALKEVVYFISKDKDINASTLAKGASFLLKNMDESEVKKMNMLFAQNGCNNQKTLNIYLQSLIKSNEKILNRTNKKKDLEMSRGR